MNEFKPGDTVVALEPVPLLLVPSKIYLVKKVSYADAPYLHLDGALGGWYACLFTHARLQEKSNE